MKPVLLSALMSAMIVSAPALAEPELPSGLYVGGGVSYNDLDFGSVLDNGADETAFGIQAFVGLPFDNNIEGFDTFAEIGFFRTDEFDFGNNVKEKVTGVNASVILQRDLNEIHENLYALGRAGFELGDDDGLLTGFGAGFRLTSRLDVRAEFVNKDLTTSYQANVLFRF